MTTDEPSDEPRSEEPFRITYFDPVQDRSPDIPGDTHPPRTSADGGHHKPPTFELALETRERVASMETSVQKVQNSVDRIEDNVDEVADKIDRVENDALDEERFERDYADDIESNSQITTILKWVAGAVVVVVSVLSLLVQIGPLP